MYFITSYLIATLTGSILSMPLMGATLNWPGLLGPERNGRVNHFKEPVIRPDKLQKVWSIQVGDGYGSPLVHDDQIYQHSRQSGHEVIRKIDFATGKEIWKNEHLVNFKMGNGGEGHGRGPKSCPSLADGRLFTFSITGELSAWDMDSGDLLWRHDESQRFEKTTPYWGASMSPIVHGEKIMVRFGNDDEGMLLAFNVESGEPLWRLGDDGACYSSPITAKLAGIDQLIEWNHNALIGVDMTSGQMDWRFALPHIGSNQNMPTPTFHNGAILVGGENRGIRQVLPTLEGSTWNVEEGWHQKRVALDMSTAVVHGNHLFGFSHFGLGQLFCMDTTSGDILWQGPSRTGENACLLAMKNHIGVLINDGRFWVIEASSKAFQKIRSYEVASGPTWAPPVLWADSLLIKDRNHLTRWSFIE